MAEAIEVPGRAFWSGVITFGLVSIPVDLFTANRPPRVSLRMLDAEGNPLRREYYCPADGRSVGSDELVRGYQIGPDQYVLVADEELEALAPRKSREIDLRRFVEVDQIDPRYFLRGYILAPAAESTKAYRLLARTMEQTGRAGIATFVMRGKEYLVAILAEGGLLHAATMRFADELRDPDDVGLPEPADVGSAEVRRIEAEIDSLRAETLDAAELEDDSAEQLLELVERKRAASRDVVEISVPAPEEEEAAEGTELIDLMEVLKQRVGAARPQRAGEARPQRAPRRAAAAARDTELAEQSKEELYRRAQALGIEGRSRMSKEELMAAIRRSG